MSLFRPEAFNEYISSCKADGHTDRDITMLLLGMKLAYYTASKISASESFACAEIAFKLQQKYDPEAKTWVKN